VTEQTTGEPAREPARDPRRDPTQASAPESTTRTSEDQLRDERRGPASEGTGNAQTTDVEGSNPNAGGPHRAAGGMGVSSERVGPTGGIAEGTDGARDTSEPAHRDHVGDLVGSDAEFDQGDEQNPAGLGPKAGYPSKDPRSDG